MKAQAITIPFIAGLPMLSTPLKRVISLICLTSFIGCGSKQPDKVVKKSPASAPAVTEPESPKTKPESDSAKLVELPLTDNSSVDANNARSFQIKLFESEKRVEIAQGDVANIPMEFLTLRAKSADGEFIEPGEKKKEDAKTIKTILKIAGKVIGPLAQRAEFLREFVEKVTCQHPVTGQEISIQEYLRYYINHNGYIEDGYFTNSDVDTDPAGVLLRLLLFDKWVIYEAKLIQAEDGSWHSIEDCLKGRFKSKYSHFALESLKNALKFVGEAKSTSRLNVVGKVKAYGNATTSYISSLLYIVEANKARLSKRESTEAAYVKIRSLAVKAKVMLHFKKNMELDVVSSL